MEDPRMKRPIIKIPKKMLPDGITAWRERQRRERAGHHGVNSYKCPECGKVTVTIDVDPGVTPMLLGCRRTPGCRGLAVSSGYPATEPPASLLEHLDWEWALPTAGEYAELDTAMMAYVDNGGLALRPRGDRPSAYRQGYWGGVVPRARDVPTPAGFVAEHFDVKLEPWQEDVVNHVVGSKVVDDERVPPGLAVPADLVETLGKAPRNRAERRAADKQAKRLRRRATREADRQVKALEATMSPEEIAAAQQLAAKTLGVRGGR
jgi:hypothetical protein